MEKELTLGAGFVNPRYAAPVSPRSRGLFWRMQAAELTGGIFFVGVECGVRSVKVDVDVDVDVEEVAMGDEGILD